MIKEAEEASISIMGKTYQIKCPPSEVESLRQAATYVEQQMYAMRQSNNFVNLEKLAVITAINIAHQYLNVESTNQDKAKHIFDRLQFLQDKIERALDAN